MTESRERVRAEEAERRLQLLIDSIRDYAIFMLDKTGHVETWNLGAQAIKGYARDEIVGKSVEVFYAPEDRAAGLPAQLLRQAREHGRVEHEGWRLRKDGSRFWADVVIAAVLGHEGELLGYSKVTRDLTERRRADLARLELARAQEVIRMRDEFLSIASHELRTPLMSVQLQLESALKLSTEPKVQTKLERASRGLLRLNELVDTLLDVSRIATGHLTLSARHVVLSEVILEVIERMHEIAERARSPVTHSLDPHVAGNFDPLRIGQVVTNLLVNALTYAAGSPVEITLRASGGQAVIGVADRGPGIATEHRERIFGRFERASDRRHYGGLGLGLFVAKEIAAAHGGSIQVRDREGGGAAFELRLPVEGVR